MFRAHRGLNRHRPLIHRGRRVASVKIHAARRLRIRKIRGIRYVHARAPLRAKRTLYRSLVKVPGSYRARKKPSPYRSIGIRNPYKPPKKARRYKAVPH